MKSKNRKNNIKNVEKLLIEIGLRIARRGEGALFVIGNNAEYSLLIDQSVKPFVIFDNPKLLESLALIDGAVIIEKNGMLKAYGAMIRSNKTYKNHGTRHSAALSAAGRGNLVVLVSQEDRKIKILKNGKLIMQIDALEKNIEKALPRAVEILESVGAGTLGTIGSSLLVPGLGIALLPGIVVFGSAYYLTKMLAKNWRK